MSIISLVFIICVNKSFAQTNAKVYDKQIKKCELIFYLGNSPKGVIYSIVINADSIKAKNHHPTDYNARNYYNGKLSVTQRASLYSLYKKISLEPIMKRNPNFAIIDDSWGTSLTINNLLRYEDNDFSIQGTPNNVKNFIKYLITLSHIKIDFSAY